ncbi:MAG TPA: helix-turn-helix transcriptional regulator [Micromonosporaceae bacterium]
MSSKGGTLRAQWLGKLLRDLRESAGVSFQEAADHIVRDTSTISRMETGSLPARMSDVRELLNLYGVDDSNVRAGFEQLTRDIWKKGWWDGYADNVHTRIIDLAWLESRAVRMRDFSPLVIHGLLQTRDYAEAVMRAIDPDATDAQIARWLDFRMKRQEALDGRDYLGVLDESVFHRSIGGPGVMREQFAHLLDLSERPNITIRVLPFSVSLAAGAESTFTLLTMPTPFPVVAQVTTEAGMVYVEIPKAARFEAAYARIESHALDVEDSRMFLKSRMEKLA